MFDVHSTAFVATWFQETDAGSTFTLDFYPAPFKRRALTAAWSPPQKKGSVARPRINSKLLGVPEGRHNVAHSAYPERSEWEAVGRRIEDYQKTPIGVAHGPHPHKISPSSNRDFSARPSNTKQKARRDVSAAKLLTAEMQENYFSAFLSSFFCRQYLSSGLISVISIPALTRNLQLSSSWAWSSSVSLPVTRQYWQS
jgi:hypothetical protein